MPETDRRLAAILAADVVDYSRLMSEAEEDTHRRLNSCLDGIKEIAGRHKGRVFGNFGDSVVVEFASSMEAVRSAIEIQSDFNARNSALPEHQRMLVRIGINIGDVLVQGDGLYGDSVNIAARLEGLARPGGIDISGEVYRQVNKKLDCEFRDLGEKKVKNIHEPIHVYEVCTDRHPGPVGKRSTLRKHAAVAATALGILVATAIGAAFLSWKEDGGMAPPPSASIAVLPLKNLSGEPDQEYICDGITNDLITDLSKFPRLFVPSSYSSYFYKGQTVRLEQMAQELGVRYILEGSIQRERASLRVNAQLIDMQTGKHIWAERYTYPDAQDLFAIQDSIVQQVVTRVADKVTEQELDQVTKQRTTNMDAQAFYTQGIALFKDGCETLEACADARDLFEKATQADDKFAHAHGWLAYAIAQGWYYGYWSEESELQLALKHANRALELDGGDPENLWSMAEVQHRLGNMQESYNYYKQATDKSGDADLHANFAELLNKMGDHAGALNEIDNALARTPKGVPDYFYWDKAYILYFMKDHQASLDELKKMADRPVWSSYLFAANYAKLNDLTQANVEMSRFLTANADTAEWTIGKEFEMEASTFGLDEDKIYWLKGLKEAGMPLGDLPADIAQQLEK